MEYTEYSVVIPCYKSSNTIGKVLDGLSEVLGEYSYDVILVNDGSPDGGNTANAIMELSRNNKNVVAVDLARNAGQHNAILCGLHFAEGEYIICMDDDLQTHPSQIPKLIEEIKKGYDVVYASYPKKKHAWYRNIASKLNSWSIRFFIGKPKGITTSSFWIAKRFVRDYIIQYQNANAFIPGLIIRTTDSIGNVEVNHFKREEGQSGYNFKSLFKLWSNIIGFSVKPLRMASVLGILFSFGGILGALIVALRKIFFRIDVVGWTSIIVAILFFSGVILLFMGLIGEYIGRMFLASGKHPQFVIRNIEGEKHNSL